MNSYKKLFLIAVVFTQSIHFYANTDLSVQEEKTDQNSTEDEYYLVQFLHQLDQDVVNFIIQSYRKKNQQKKHLTKIKKLIIDPQYQQSIQDVSTHISEQQKYFETINQFLSKPSFNNKDITDFAPKFAQSKYIFFQEYNKQSNHAKMQERNFILLSRLQEIEENKSKNNLGNWIRNTHSSNPRSFLGRIDRTNEEE